MTFDISTAARLTAARLSQEAYTDLEEYKSGGAPVVLTGDLAGWQVDTDNSFSSGDSQFITFFNNGNGQNRPPQVFITFKGSDSFAELRSDIFNAGNAAWVSLKTEAASKLAQIKLKYPGYDIIADGHSLGGGMAQTFALENNLSGYGQNSLPIAGKTIQDEFTNQGIDYETKVGQWRSTYTFDEINTAGDLATMSYTAAGGKYLDRDPQQIASPYFETQKLAAKYGGGLTVVNFLGWMAHGIDTVIASLQGAPGTVGTLTSIEVQSVIDVANQFNTINDLQVAVADAGFHVASFNDIETAGGPGDGGSTIADVIAAQASTNGISIDGTTLEQINGTFSDSSFEVGGVVHVPTAMYSGNSNTLLSLASGKTYVLHVKGDAGVGAVYQVGGSLDGHDDGALYVVGTDGSVLTFDKGTYAGVSAVMGNNGVFSSSNKFSVILASPAGAPIGSLSLGAGVLSLADGVSINLSVAAGLHITSPVAGADAMDSLVNYLSQLGHPMTAGEINQLHFDTKHPGTVTPHVVEGNGVASGDVYYNPGASPGAIMIGKSTTLVPNLGGYTEVPANNILVVSNGDISQDTISNIPTLQMSGSVGLTAEQLAGFTVINGSGTAKAETAGTYDISAKNTTDRIDMTADNWGGTTLIGNNAHGEVLRASLLGNDTLRAGNGAGVSLYAGNGNNTVIGGNGGNTLYAGHGASTLTGGTGNDTFVIDKFMGTGSVVTGGNGIDTLTLNTTLDYAKLDISSISQISGVEALNVVMDNPFHYVSNSSLKLTADELGSLGSISSTGTTLSTAVMAAAGTYDLTGKTTPFRTLDASGVTGDVTLNLGSNAAGLSLGDMIGGSGNDTFIVNENSSVNSITGGRGNDTFILNTNSDVYYAFSGGAGDDTVIMGDHALFHELVDIENVKLEQGTAAISLSADDFNTITSLEAANGSQLGIFLYEAGTFDLSTKSVEGLVELNAAHVTGDVTLIGSDQDGLRMGGGSGNSVLYAGNGNNTMLWGGSGNAVFHDGAGIDFLVGGTGNDTFILDHATAGTIISDTGGNDSVFDSTGDLSAISISGVEILATTADNLKLNAAQLSSTALSAIVGFSPTATEPGTLYASTAGTYDLSSKTVIWFDTLDASAAAGSVTLNGGSSVTTLIGSAYSDVFALGPMLLANTVLSGGAGTDILQANSIDISSASVSGIETLSANVISLTASQLNSFTTVQKLINVTAFGTITGTTGGTYSLAGGRGTRGYNMVAGSNAGTTLIQNNVAGATMTASASGNDTLIAGTAGNILVAGGGVDTLIGGAGADTLVVASAGAGSTISGGGGTDTLVPGTDITRLAIANDVEILSLASGGVKLTGAQLAGFSRVQGTATLFATTAGTYSLAGKTLVGNIVLDTSLVSGDSTLVATDSGATLKAGSGNDTLIGGAGSDTLIAGTGNNTLTGGNGNNTYTFTSALSTSTYLINNFHTDNGQSKIQMAAGVPAQKVALTRSGNDLVMTMSDDPIIVQNYFASDSYKVAAIEFADGTAWDQQAIASHVGLPEGVNRIGSEVLVNTQTTSYQTQPNITGLDGSGFIVTWTDAYDASGSDGTGIKAQMFDAGGNKVGSEMLVNSFSGSQGTSKVTGLSNGGFVVTWHDYSGALGGSADGSIKAQVYDPGGAKVGTELLVSTVTGGSQAWPAVTSLTGGGFVIAFEDNSGTFGTSAHSVVAQMFSTSGAKVGAEFLVDTPSADWQGLVQLAGLPNGGFVATWEDQDGSGISGYSVKGRIFDASGNKLGNEFQVNTTGTEGLDAKPMVAALASGGFVMVWSGLYSGQAQMFDAAGTKVGSEFAVGPASNVSGPFTVTSLTNDGFAVAWSDYGAFDTSAPGIVAQLYDASGAKTGSQFLVNNATNGAQWYPSIIGLADGNLAAAWQDASGTLGDSRGTSVKAQLFGMTGLNTVTGTSGNDTLLGFGGATLIGNGGNDTYQLGTGFGHDVISNQDSSGFDVVSFGAEARDYNLWFKQSNNDLTVQVLGTSDAITIHDWYLNDAQKVDQFSLANGEKLDKLSVDLLVQAMAGFDPQTMGTVRALSDLPQSVQTTIASNWHN